MAQKTVEVPAETAAAAVAGPQIMNNHSGRAMPTAEDKTRPAMPNVIPDKEIPTPTQPVKKNIEPLKPELDFEEEPVAQAEEPVAAVGAAAELDAINGGASWVSMATQNAATQSLESNKLAEEAKNAAEDQVMPIHDLKIHHEEHVLRLEHKLPAASAPATLADASLRVQAQPAAKPAAPAKPTTPVPEKKDGVTISHGDDGTTVRWR